MSVLSKEKIQELINKQELAFEPQLDDYQIQPTSVDLRIGWSFYIPYSWKFNDKGRVAVVADYLDYAKTHENFQLIKLKPKQYFEILPGETIIASSLEKISLNSGKHIGWLQPRSSSSRRGLSIESGVINPNYTGHLIIPLTNNSHQVIKIYPGERLCQIVFSPISGNENLSDNKESQSKYQNTTPYGLEIKLDPQEELSLLKEGKLDELKKKGRTL